MSDDVIDLGEYLRKRDEDHEPASTFALWGADGERSRFALPLWRSIYLASGERGGIVWQTDPSVAPRPFVVLDLAKDPARTDFSGSVLEGLADREAPALVDSLPGSLAIYLGERDAKRWYIVIVGDRDRMEALAARDREDVLFLAGECAGLLFLRDFASGAD